MNTVPGSVCIRLGFPCAAIFSDQNSISFLQCDLLRTALLAIPNFTIRRQVSFFLFIRILKWSSKIDPNFLVRFLSFLFFFQFRFVTLSILGLYLLSDTQRNFVLSPLSHDVFSATINRTLPVTLHLVRLAGSGLLSRRSLTFRLGSLNVGSN